MDVEYIKNHTNDGLSVYIDNGAVGTLYKFSDEWLYFPCVTLLDEKTLAEIASKLNELNFMEDFPTPTDGRPILLTV